MSDSPGRQERPIFDQSSDAGEMARRVALLDWSETPLGPIETWPRSLTTAVRILLSSRYPMFIWWGPDLINIYNDGYVPILGARHPHALGKSAPHIWKDVWPVVGPQSEVVRREGRSTWNESVLLLMERLGFVEETYFTFSYSPAPDDDGGVGGVFCACMEETKRVLAARRLKTLRSLGEQSFMEMQNAAGACAAAATVLSENTHDVPFALIYLFDRDGQHARLHGAFNSETESGTAAPHTVIIGKEADVWDFRAVIERGAHLEENLDQRFGRLSAGPWEDDQTRNAIVLPLARPGVQESPAGFLVAGISPRLIFDQEYRGFFELVAGQIATAVANARAYEEERRRADALAELDRSKTAFFSNVSHEFRTPLTLMLGPLEEALAAGDTVPSAIRGQLEAAHRNSLRLLKLVNTLLDFSRIEAGRIEATYEPVDLPMMTADLVSVFRSAIEKAGLRLIVETPSLPEPVYVDPEMWEKVVLNLVSNAFKFTLDGEIAVRLQKKADVVELTVADTGSGIPASELPRIFDRFHRIEGAPGRSHEGTGIGLALVAELVKLHGGRVEATSEAGRGSEFKVTIPLGKEHLPPERIQAPATRVSSKHRRDAWLGETLQWIREDEAPGPAAPQHGRVLFADDNADMRHYVTRLLTVNGYEVESVQDGQAALTAIRKRIPDLVIADVMMPNLDGFRLVGELRAAETTRTLPVILLSARAGEDSRVEGLQTGADDYLVKPFSAKELLARVRAHLEISRVRGEAEVAARESEQRFRNMADHAPVMSWMTDATGTCVFLNKPWYEFTGQTPETGLGSGWLDAVHPDDREQSARIFLRSNERREPLRMEYRLRRFDGQYRWAIDSAAPWIGTGGEFLGYIGSVIDIDDRKEAEARLQAATAKFEAVFNQSGIFAGILDLQGRLLEVNNLAVEWCGYSRDEVLDRSFWDAPWWRGSEAVKGRIREAVGQARSGAVFRETLRYWVADGSERLVDFAIHPIRDAKGAVIFLHPTGIDITERQASAEALRSQRELLEVVVRHMPAAVSLIRGSDLRLQMVNAAYQAIAPGKEMLGRTLDEIWPEATQDFTSICRRVLRTGEPYHAVDELNTIRRTAEGPIERAYFTWSLHRVPLPDQGGHGLLNMAWETTQRKQAEENLAESENRFRTLADNMSQLAWMADPKGSVFWYNQRWYDFTGTTLEEMQGWGWRNVHHPDHVDRVVAGVQHSWDSGEPWEDTFPLRGKNGEYRWFLSRALPIKDDAGNVVRWFGTNTDVTLQRDTEEALRSADRIKDEFLAILSHELRTPLTSILGWAQMLRGMRADEEIVQAGIEAIERSAKLQSQLIEDVLDVSRITTGKMRLDPRPSDLREVIESAVDTVRGAAEAKEITLTVDLDRDVGLASVDPDRVRQIVWNLVSNAIKFTTGGGRVEVSLYRGARDVSIVVADDGPGIPASFLPHLFERFRQADSSSRRGHSGLGLGLALTKHLAELHGGDISVESEEGHGARFTVTLPLADRRSAGRDQGLQERDEEGALQGMRILFVDDDPYAREMFGAMLERQGGIVGTVASVDDALAVLEDFAPDLVVTDVAMPQRDGYDLLGEIRSRPRYARLPVLALTAHGVRNEFVHTETGFSTVLSKPIDMDELIAAVARTVDR